ncbi:hypothetical protein Pelo_12255 [Pelomyxa schiedti]|nr:hypothetical protein Pelo_12255 [Pelomyxa schiedti]
MTMSAATQSNLTFVDASTLLTLVDRFHEVNPSSTQAAIVVGICGTPCLWDLNGDGGACALERRFMEVARGRVDALLEHLGLTLEGVAPGVFGLKGGCLGQGEGEGEGACGWGESEAGGGCRCCRGCAGMAMGTGRGAAWLCGRRVGCLRRWLEGRISVVGSMNYVEWVGRVLAAGTEFIKRELPEIVARGILDPRLEASPIFPIGMPADEITFQAAGTRILLFPDANLFNEDHKQIWEITAPRPGRILRDFLFSCSYSPLHEMVHCMQYSTIGPTSAENMWIKEFGACSSQLEFMHAIESTFPPGFVYEIILWFWELVSRLHSTIPQSVIDGYKSWRDSRAALPPVQGQDAVEYLTNNRAAAYYVKSRLALEAYKQGTTIAPLLRGQLLQLNGTTVTNWGVQFSELNTASTCDLVSP